jgi:hypothetical protein
MIERKINNGAPGVAETDSESTQSGSNRSRLIASAIALLSSAALVTWAAMHSQM